MISFYCHLKSDKDNSCAFNFHFKYGHDNDSKVWKMIQEIMVDVEEQLCTGHGCKNLFQKLKKIGQKAKHKELLHYSMPATIAMRFIHC